MILQLGLTALLAFYVAWNLGANDVANAMGTSVGSKAVTLRQALIIAGVLEFAGAVLFGHEVSETLATEIVNPAFFVAEPQVLLIGMFSVLLAAGLWLQIATSRGFPVSSSHAVVGAIAGFSWVAVGIQAIDWSLIGTISLAWVVTPLISGTIAALFYSVIKFSILDRQNSIQQLNEWIPWLSTALLSVFGVIVLPKISQPIYTYFHEQLHWNIPKHDLPIGIGAIAAISLTMVSWKQLNGVKQDIIQVEKQLAKFQLLSACFVAFAHGSNDVGNAIAPLAVINYISLNNTVPVDGITIPLWILVLGGAGIVTGLAVWGKKVIATIGEGIIPLQPSAGFCAELATATTILLASRIGIPVSTSHALVGGVVGIGLVQGNKSIQFKTVQGIIMAWLITVPAGALLGATIFAIARYL
ncbi:inorganic phosphate transporter [Gloeocapsopsis crepidinum LEGE 06123]|uniref:Phosphate transporter n=1 Tax=Gloeocapsopsis crepidinum LEGE 06123 TaxID=588587 RepID=A0ABR9UUE1_9CHRO|nr:inorganic phosphate transporter [Gloeocapsopsis crepidinum]MBE9191926.1 inorganic phosphate transporter [Gloeocapsopsis crepidinum LEGE 06123]